MTMAQYRAGIIGCGNIAKVHAAGYRASMEVDLVAGAEIVPERLQSFCDEWEVSERYADYHEMLVKEKLDIVSICTRNNQHVEPTLAAAEAGVKAVFVEKPMALNLGDADRMIESCDRHGVKLFVDHTMRFEANYRRLKEQIDEGIIGDLTMVEVIAIGDLGELTHNATHSFDTLCMFGGEPCWLFAHLERDVKRRNDREDLVTIVAFDHGVRGKVIYGGYYDYRYEGFVFEGTRGRIETVSATGWQPEMRLWTPGKNGASPFRDGELMDSIANDPWTIAVEDMVADLKGVRPCTTDGRRGRKALEMTMAAYESRRHGGVRIAFPFNAPESPLDVMLEGGQLPRIWARGLQVMS